ncbi:hypothetical protein PMIT1320_00494 [Prochlorococcus marinus str. MIT 1320]|nr:hypothetical protein PMIT1320_00494 [Prochlorococcus marinus str. MIT 1320]
MKCESTGLFQAVKEQPQILNIQEMAPSHDPELIPQLNN